jgi:hypothetical protein
VAPPYGARNPDPGPQPSAAHGAVLAVSIALAATLIALGTAGGNTGLIALLMLLVGCGALVVPVAMVVNTWAQARLVARVLLALAGLACALLLAFAVVQIAAIVPTLL